MAVYTEVTDDDLAAFMAAYDIGDVVSFKGIAEGVENSNYLLATTTKLVDGLVIRPDRMQQVLDSSYGLVFSQRVLLGLVEEGLTREEAYAAVQRNAMTAWDTGQPLKDLLAKDPDVQGKIDPSRLDAMFDPSHHLRHVDEVFERVEAL